MAKRSNSKSKAKSRHPSSGAPNGMQTIAAQPPTPEAVAQGVVAAVVEQVAAAFEPSEPAAR